MLGLRRSQYSAASAIEITGRVIARSLDATHTDEPALQADFKAALDALILNIRSRKSKFWELFKVILRAICDLTKCSKTTISCRGLAGWTPASSPSNKGESCNVSHTGQCPSGKCLWKSTVLSGHIFPAISAREPCRLWKAFQVANTAQSSTVCLPRNGDLYVFRVRIRQSCSHCTLLTRPAPKSITLGHCPAIEA